MTVSEETLVGRPSECLPLVASSFPGKPSVIKLWTSWDELAAVSVMDRRSAEPQIDADALIDARAHPPRLAGTRQLY